MHRILITLCVLFSIALGGKHGHYGLRHGHYGLSRREDIQTLDSTEDRDQPDDVDNGSLPSGEEKKESAEDNGDNNDPNLTGEDNGDNNADPNLTGEDNGDNNADPNLTGEDNNADPNLTGEGKGENNADPNITGENNSDSPDNPSGSNEDQNDKTQSAENTNESNQSSEESNNSNEASVEKNPTDSDGAFHIDPAKDKLDVKRYKAELAAGDPTQLRDTNPHYHVPHFYTDLSRRFVPVYPYKEIKVKSQKNAKDLQDVDLVPIWAPPELVLAIMKEAVKNQPVSRDDEDFTRQSILRSGDYFDGVWKEEIKTDNLLQNSKSKALRSSKNKSLRSSKNKAFRTSNNNRHRNVKSKEAELNSLPITANLLPGTKLYNLISKVARHSPRLVYIINE